MINILFESPKILANNNEPPKNTHAKKQLDPSVGNNESQNILAEEEQHKKKPYRHPNFR